MGHSIAYVYCENQDRPLKEAEGRITGNDYLTSYFCNSCDKKADIIITMKLQDF